MPRLRNRSLQNVPARRSLVTTARFAIRFGFFAALMIGRAHEPTVLTHSFSLGPSVPGPKLRLLVTDAETDEPIAARVTINVDGEIFTPNWLNENGIRFTSLHRSKKQSFTAIYARGVGPLEILLPPDAHRVEVTAVKGFEYLPVTSKGVVVEGQVDIFLPMKRWVNLTAQGWIAVDEHLHYDRINSTDDRRWLEILAGDGLTAGHFLVLKGGLVPGLWAQQYAYGPAGQATDGERLIIPGEEYRDAEQGHINLLGVSKVIEPVSTGGIGVPKVLENYPPFHDVLNRARSFDALVGVAHGGIFGRHATAVADVVLGAVDFWELSNGFVYSVETWYRLMNCGYFIPPAAGTDLPILPYRDEWQPMLGAVRTYVNTGGKTDFSSFKEAMTRGEIFVTGGPIIGIEVNEKVAGETVTLPSDGGFVTIRGHLFSPRMPNELVLIRDGIEVPVPVRKTVNGSVYEWRFEAQVYFERSGWLAVQGRGAPIVAQGIHAMAHTNAVKIIVDDRPIRSAPDRIHLVRELRMKRDHFAAHGVYRTDAERQHALDVLDRAISLLERR